MEDFIRKNSKLFDSDEPSDAHFDKFLEKLGNRKKLKRISFVRKSYSIAALLLFLVISATLANLLYNNLQFESKFKTSVENAEFGEIKVYYETTFYRELTEFKQLSCDNSDINKEEILKEVKRFEINYLELKKELEKNGNNQFIINAMIENMQDRNEFLTKVLSKVKENC